jgi:hypothetical protein
MANCRFIRAVSNKARRIIATTFPRVINGIGSYTGAPGVIEDASFPMSNVLTVGRKGNVWVVPDGAGSNAPDTTSVLLEIDLGAQWPIAAAGLLGMTFNNGSHPTAVYIECIPNTNTYNAAGYVRQFSSQPILSPPTRDGGAILASPVTARYWRFFFNNATSGSGFSVAGVVVSLALTDLGFLYSGATETRIRPRSMIESFDESASVTFLGPEFVRWSIQFNNNDAALRTTLDQLYGDVQPFIFITPDLKWQECVWGTEEFSREHIWAPPDRYRFVVELRQLS